VTRLGKFSPNIFTHWAFVYFGQFLENSRSCPLFFYGKGYAFILTNCGMGYILGDYFTLLDNLPKQSDRIGRIFADCVIVFIGTLV
jgi:hypothetical protein